MGSKYCPQAPPQSSCLLVDSLPGEEFNSQKADAFHLAGYVFSDPSVCGALRGDHRAGACHWG